MPIEMAMPVHRVNRDNHPVDTKVMLQHGIRPDGEQDRRRICQASGFHDHPVDTGNGAPLVLVQQGAQDLHEILPYGAADASMAKQYRLFLDLVHQVVIESNVAKLVDENRRPLPGSSCQKPAQEGCLATAQKASDNGERACSDTVHAVLACA
jgi:hypothetical protein